MLGDGDAVEIEDVEDDMVGVLVAVVGSAITLLEEHPATASTAQAPTAASQPARGVTPPPTAPAHVVKERRVMGKTPMADHLIRTVSDGCGKHVNDAVR